ncbi:pirin family protein [Verrucomicrobiota bacterium sgz303538]
MTTTALTQPQVTVRRADERGHTKIGWLDSRHTFSFGEYYDPQHVAFRSLRVINDDNVAPGMGFGTHPHRDMEILTYVISGELQHRDSMGNGRIISPGELQAMSAGSGITHSEFNPSRANPVHFLQIWIIPSQRGLTPSYAEWKPATEPTQGLTLLGSTDSANGSVQIHQDAQLFLGRVEAGQGVTHRTDSTRGLWVQVISGELEVAGEVLQPGDAVAVESAAELTLNARQQSEFLLFDLA